jgi:glycosyltransferase involved in cell wall biosynthesis
VKGLVANIVYVDSGSTDGSVAFASASGVDIVELDMSIPFSAGRARNEGFDALLASNPDLEFVQFIDGDCQIEPSWLEAATDFLSEPSDYAIVCGRRKEIYPQASVYNRLCDIEWNTPVGDALACGGDFLTRVEAFRQVHGFNPEVVAGEEPEMCFRMRERGLKIKRIDQDMTYHDAQMMNIKQWWLRAKRCGHAYAQGNALHGDSEENYYGKEVRSAMVWGLVIPIAAVSGLMASLVSVSVWFVLIAAVPAGVLMAKVFKYSFIQRRLSAKHALLYSWYVMMAKLPELVGVYTFKARQRWQRKIEIIEYK